MSSEGNHFVVEILKVEDFVLEALELLVSVVEVGLDEIGSGLRQ